jgi:hypothetical protein
MCNERARRRALSPAIWGALHNIHIAWFASPWRSKTCAQLDGGEVGSTRCGLAVLPDLVIVYFGLLFGKLRRQFGGFTVNNLKWFRFQNEDFRS